MKRFRYDTSGSWYKGNTHIHSVVSDGALNFQQLADLYHGAGYDFLFRTDHWSLSDVSQDPQAYPLLWLDGVELDGLDERGAYFHVACLGSLKGIAPEMSFPQALASVRKQGGLAILAHPHWTGNRLEEALSLPFDGVEVYNNVCQGMNGKGYAGPIWDSMLEERPDLLAFASDDTHLGDGNPDWNGGWIMVNALACARENLLQAIRAGNFYSSTGPEFHSITYQSGRVCVQTSAVKYIRLVGPRSACEKIIDPHGCGLTQAEFEIPTHWNSAYIQIEDDTRQMAWTNPLFLG